MHLDQLKTGTGRCAHFVLEDNAERIAAFHAKLTQPPLLQDHTPFFSDNAPDFLAEIARFRSVPDNVEIAMILHLDHDLGGQVMVDPSREDCGSEVVRQMIACGAPALHPCFTIVHSYNTIAALWMITALQEAGFHAAYLPFAE